MLSYEHFPRGDAAGFTRRRLPGIRAPKGGLALAAAALLIASAGCSRRTLELDEIQKMAYAVKPAVVRVNSYATATIRIEPTRENAREETSVAELAVRTGAGGSGTGFVIHPDGWILTSAHVIEPTLDEASIRTQLLRNGAMAILQRSFDGDVVRALARSGEIETMITRVIDRATLSDVEVVNRVDLSNGRSFPFEVSRLSPPTSHGGQDLALIKVDGQFLPTLRLATDPARLQEGIWIAGYPSVASSEDTALGGWLSAETDLEPTITSGSITAIRKSVDSQTIYQTDAPAYPGHSGGPAVDRSGLVIGIPTWGHADADQIRFLIPAVTAREFVDKTPVPLDVQGPFNEAYRAALESAGRGDWQSAATRLRKADAIFPGSPDVEHFLNEAERAGAVKRFRWTEATASVAFGVAVLILLVAVIRSRPPSRRRHELPLIREKTVVNPARGDRNGEEAVSFRENGTGVLGTFTVLNGHEAGRQMGLGGSGIRIGRESRYCEIVLSDPKISRLHAEIVSFDGQTMLIDRSSSNGTFVNDERIERTFLHDGDIIYFGGRHAVAVAFSEG